MPQPHAIPQGQGGLSKKAIPRLHVLEVAEQW